MDQPTPSKVKHSYPITVQDSHLDMLGHVNHANYLVLFETARAEMIKGYGFGFLLDIKKTGISPIVLEVTLKFRRELRLGQLVSIETEVISYSKRLAIIVQEIKDTEGTRCCSARFKFGLFDLKRRKLIPPSPDWIKALGLTLP